MVSRLIRYSVITINKKNNYTKQSQPWFDPCMQKLFTCYWTLVYLYWLPFYCKANTNNHYLYTLNWFFKHMVLTALRMCRRTLLQNWGNYSSVFNSTSSARSSSISSSSSSLRPSSSMMAKHSVRISRISSKSSFCSFEAFLLLSLHRYIVYYLCL